MSQNSNSKKGGARPGAGRPKKSVGRDIVQVKLHIYSDQRETLKALGGSDWLQKTLDMATAERMKMPWEE